MTMFEQISFLTICDLMGQLHVAIFSYEVKSTSFKTTSSASNWPDANIMSVSKVIEF